MERRRFTWEFKLEAVRTGCRPVGPSRHDQLSMAILIARGQNQHMIFTPDPALEGHGRTIGTRSERSSLRIKRFNISRWKPSQIIPQRALG